MDEIKPKRRYHRPGEAVWARVRAAYLGGATMEDCAERFGVTVEAIKNRIWRDGWSKRDYAAAVAEAPEGDALDPAAFAPRRDAQPPPPLWLPEDYAPSGPAESGAARSGSKGSRGAGPKGESWGAPTWFRLTDEAWALIREEYLDGATAKQLAARWRVGASSIYRRASAEGWTKDSRAALIVEEVMTRDAAERAAGAARRSEEAAMAMAAAVARAEAEARAPGSPLEMADAAFAGAARAFAAGRADEAQRLLKLAEQARRMSAASESAQDEAAARAPFARDEVVVTIDQLISLTERWAELMIVGDLNQLPAILVHAAARWRRFNLSRGFEGQDRDDILERSANWYHWLYGADGEPKAGPPDLARFVVNHRDLFNMSQVAPYHAGVDGGRAKEGSAAGGRARWAG